MRVPGVERLQTPTVQMVRARVVRALARVQPPTRLVLEQVPEQLLEQIQPAQALQPRAQVPRVRKEPLPLRPARVPALAPHSLPLSLVQCNKDAVP